MQGEVWAQVQVSPPPPPVLLLPGPAPPPALGLGVRREGVSIVVLWGHMVVTEGIRRQDSPWVTVTKMDFDGSGCVGVGCGGFGC